MVGVAQPVLARAHRAIFLAGYDTAFTACEIYVAPLSEGWRRGRGGQSQRSVQCLSDGIQV